MVSRVPITDENFGCVRSSFIIGSTVQESGQAGDRVLRVVVKRWGEDVTGG